MLRDSRDWLNLNPELPLDDYVYGREVLGTFKTFLTLPDGPEERAQNLAGELRRLCSEVPAGTDERGNTVNGWELITTIYKLVHCVVEEIPHNDEKQDVLASTLNILYRTDEYVRQDEGKPCKWKGLPEFSISVREWYDNGDATEYEARRGIKPTEEELYQWRNWTAFLARLAVKDIGGLCYGIWSVRETLEGGMNSKSQSNLHVKGLSLYTRLCGIRDWFEIAGQEIFAFLRASAAVEIAAAEKDTFGSLRADAVEEDITDRLVRSYEPGKLCGEDISTFGAERWSFWKQRLGEISGHQLNELELSADQTLPLCNAIHKIMEWIEQAAGFSQGEKWPRKEWK